MSILREIVQAKRARLPLSKRAHPAGVLRTSHLFAQPRRSLADAIRRHDDAATLRHDTAAIRRDDAATRRIDNAPLRREDDAATRRQDNVAIRREDDAATRRNDGIPIRFLCEIKRASPSAGWIREGADAVWVAERYREHGAAAISLLTEEEFFRGQLEDLPRVREVGLSLLMKDFFVDPYQVVLARGLGADALLLIAALEDRPLLEEIRAAARELGIEVLVEVHDEAECEMAHRLAPELVGVNNRNLSTFEVSLATSDRLFPLLPSGTVRLSESGIKSRPEVTRLEAAGFDGLLVGETLMRAEDPGVALDALREATSHEAK